MNCANHPDYRQWHTAELAESRFVAACKRDVMGVIYCEQCLAERLGDAHPDVPPIPSGYVAVRRAEHRGSGRIPR